MKYLGKSEKFVEELGQKAILLPGWAQGQATDWIEEDVIRAKILMDYGVMKDWLPGRKYDVLYCRVEPNIADLGPATKRAAAMKERMLTWILGRGMSVDLTIAEVRPAMRYRMIHREHEDEYSAQGFQTLLGLLSRRKVRTLYIESRDRLNIGNSWFMIEDICKIGKCEIVVMNSVWPTAEMRAEAKGWMADVLLWYKVMSGEIDNSSIADTFLKGYDQKLTLKLTSKVDAKLTQVVKVKRQKKKKWENIPAKQRVIDLADCWDTTDILKARENIGLPSSSPD